MNIFLHISFISFYLAPSLNKTLDFCKGCFPSEDKAIKMYGNQGDAPDGRGNSFSYDESHPDYSGEGYGCEKCGKELTGRDN
jgi:hypothetical protein